MKEQQAQIQKDVDDRAKKHAEKQRKYEESQRQLQAEMDNRYNENKKRATKTGILNVFTLGIYGAATKGKRQNERE